VEVKDFRPISLIGGMHKIISKVLANRLKLVFGKIVSHSPTAFIKGRQILDSVLVASECLDIQLLSGALGIIWGEVAMLDSSLHLNCPILYPH